METPLSIFLYVPNIIGYFRIICSLGALCVAFQYPRVSLFLYVMGFVLDAFDGIAARKLNQTSQVGAVLDMVTDRASTLGLVMVLALLYPQYGLGFTLLNVLDISSHWVRMYSSLLRGFKSHKAEESNEHWLLKMYYDKDNRLFMLVCCLGQELFYLGLYSYYFEQENFQNHENFALIILGVLFFPFLMKQILNFMQFYTSFHDIAVFEIEKKSQK